MAFPLDLPNELLFQIFSYLSYWDLKLRVPLVCKRFHTVVATRTRTGAIDRILFRDEARPFVAADAVNVYQPNPAVSRISMTVSSNGKKVLQGLPHTTKGASFTLTPDFITDNPIRFENAVSPAVSKLSVRVSPYDTLELDGSRNPNGAVSVLDVLKAATEYKSPPPPRGTKARFIGQNWTSREHTDEMSLELICSFYFDVQDEEVVFTYGVTPAQDIMGLLNVTRWR